LSKNVTLVIAIEVTRTADKLEFRYRINDSVLSYAGTFISHTGITPVAVAPNVTWLSRLKSSAADTQSRSATELMATS